MKSSLDYLEARQVEELTAQLEKEGYVVEAQASRAAANGEARYDLIATRMGRRVAIEVKAASRLKEFAEELRELRRRAREQNMEFRLVVVTPPSQRAITVAGFDERLRFYLMDKIVELETLGDLPPGTVVSNVSHVEINTLYWGEDESRAAGTGVLDVVLNGAQTTVTRDPEPVWAADFPFDFDAVLDCDRGILRCDVRMDTSSLRQEIEAISPAAAAA